MRLKDLLAAALQVVAITFILTSAINWAAIILNLFGPGLGNWKVFVWPSILNVASAIFVCAFADQIAARLVTDKEAIVSTGGLSPGDCFTVVIFGMGLVLVFRALPAFTSLVVHTLSGSAAQRPGVVNGIDIESLARAIVPIAAGFILIFKARSLGNRYATKQGYPSRV